MNEALLVSIGAVPGAFLRYRMVNHLAPMLPRRHWGTFGVNMIACFSLGLLISLEGRACLPSGLGANRTMLLLGTGFLGSLSTFSTFMAEVLATLRQHHWREMLLVTGGSVVAGLLAMLAGLSLGS